MKQKHKTYLNWSSGKDASLTLYYLQQDEKYQVDHLLTTVNSHYDRVSMHGVRRSLLELQVKSIGIPFSTVELPESPNMEEYEIEMRNKLEQFRSDGFTISAFGDIFLEELRLYRESQLKQIGFQAYFPLWKRNTKELVKEFIDLGFKAIVVCVNSEFLNESFVGRVIDMEFINNLPANVDPCGENGEFHSFCYDGPIFNSPIEFTVGEKIYKEYKNPKQEEGQVNKASVGYWFCDLLL